MGRKSREKRERKARDAEFRRTHVDPPKVRYRVRPRPSSGTTGSERLLVRLAHDTFLSLWSYPNVVRDERQANGGLIGKEIADLLVVFENDVILFSDKDCAFPSTGNPDVDWIRWYRKAIESGAKQLWGAERQIRANPGRIFIDPRCETRLPVPLPDASRIRIHRVVVAHGASARCRDALRGSGSLSIVPGITGAMHHRSRLNGGVPFAVGLVDPARPFVHVLDDMSLELLLENLDTVSDFVGYLRKKEAFVLSGQLGSAAGEEALLGLYVAKVNANDEHDFVLPDSVAVPVALDERRWHHFLTSSERRRKIEADRVSYYWDALIETFAGHYLAGTSHHLSEDDSEHYEFERVLRFFARESRLRRRLLAQTVFDMQRITHPTIRRLRVVPPMRTGDPYWLLLLFPNQDNLLVGRKIDYEQYRKVRAEYLNSCLRVVKLMYPDAHDIVGFCTESGRTSYGSEDAAYLDAREWSSAADDDARTLQKKLQILVSAREVRIVGAEYPQLD